MGTNRNSKVQNTVPLGHNQLILVTEVQSQTARAVEIHCQGDICKRSTTVHGQNTDAQGLVRNLHLETGLKC